MDVFTVHIHFNIFLARIMSTIQLLRLLFFIFGATNASQQNIVLPKETENDCRHTEGLLQTSSCSVIGLPVALGRKPLDSLSQSNWLGLPSQGYFLGTLIISLPASL